MSRSSNEGRNEIRFNNSEGKCLLENWVEERAVRQLEQREKTPEKLTTSQLLKQGHAGLLTTDFNSSVENQTTFRKSFTSPLKSDVKKTGKKQEMLKQMLTEEISKEVHSEFNLPPDPVDYTTVTHNDFNKSDFVSKKPVPTANHDYVSEQPISYWSENKERVHGISQVKSRDSPFRKNSAFSKPIEEYFNQPQPYTDNNYPNM